MSRRVDVVVACFLVAVAFVIATLDVRRKRPAVESEPAAAPSDMTLSGDVSGPGLQLTSLSSTAMTITWSSTRTTLKILCEDAPCPVCSRTVSGRVAYEGLLTVVDDEGNEATACRACFVKAVRR